MNVERLIFKMGEEVIFAHNQVTKFLCNTFFNTNSLVVTMVILKAEQRA
jgi:uncharacterized protein